MPPHIRMYDGSKDPEDHLSLFSRVAINSEWRMPRYTQIRAFMYGHKCPELSKKFPHSIPKTIDEMMERVDDFLRDKRKPHKPSNYYRGGYRPYSRDACPSYPREGRSPYQQHRPAQLVTINSLSKTPSKILTSKHQLNLPRLTLMIGVPQKVNLCRLCEYHGEKGYYTDDCYQLKKLLETALESGKANHLVREVKNKGKGNQEGKSKVINMVGL
ncbi:hypothetical protein Tco_1295880 [Tanacetum coccineum]